MRVSRWDLLGLTFLAAFGVSLGALVHRHGARVPADVQLLDPSTEVQLGTEWMGLYFRGEKVGLTRLTKAARAEGGYRFESYTTMRLLALHGDAPLELEVDADLDAGLTLEAFRFSVDAGPASLAGKGTVEGTTVTLRLTTGGQVTERQLELAQPPVLRSNLGPMLSRTALEPGTRFRYETFDPLTQRAQPVDVEVVGRETVRVLQREVDAIHVRQSVGGLTLDGWMNQRGEMLRQELGLGLVAVRETEDEARWGVVQARAGRTAADFIEATMVPAEWLPASLEHRPVLQLRLAGVELERFELDGGRQRLDGDVLTVTREAVGAGLPLPVTDAPADSLEASALVQADHPAIQRAARRAIGDAADTLTAARRLLAFVHGHLEQKLVPGVPSALETLKARVGDCNEHSTLFAALARSVGVPTRVVVGLVYREGRFGYHAWNEVQAADGWVTVDATWNQLPVSVGHLRFLRGGLDKQVEILPVIGRLRVSAP